MSRSILIAIALGLVALVASHAAQPATLGAPAVVLETPAGAMGSVAQYFGNAGASTVTDVNTYIGAGPRVLRLEFDPDAGEMRVSRFSQPLGDRIIGLADQGGLLYATLEDGGLITIEDTGADLEVIAELSRSKSEFVAAVPDGLLLTDWGSIDGFGGGVELFSLRDARRPAAREPIRFPIRDLPDNYNFDYRTFAAGDKAFVFYQDNYGGRFLSTIAIEPGPTATILAVAEVDLINVYDAAIAGDNLFVIGQYGLVVLDVSDPTAPEIVHRYEPFPSFYPDHLTTDGRLVVLSSGSNSAGERHGLVVLDAREPEVGLPEVAHLELEGIFGAIYLQAGRLVAIGGSEGGSIEVREFAVDDTGSITERGALRQPGSITRLAVDEERVFTVGRSDAWALDVAADGVDTGERVLIPASQVNAVAVWDEHLVAATREGLLVLHVSPDGAATLVGELTRDPVSDPHFGVHVVAGGVAYMLATKAESRSGSASAELWVVDLTVPSTPELVSVTTVPSDVLDLALVDDVVVLLGNDLTLVDVRDVALPRLRGSVTIGHDPIGLVDVGRGSVLAIRETRLVLVDVTDADIPRIADTVVVEEAVLTVGGHGPTAFALLRSRNPEERILRLARFEVNDAGVLERKESVEVDIAPDVNFSQLGGIEVVGDVVLVPGSWSGLFVVDLVKDLGPVFLPMVLDQH